MFVPETYTLNCEVLDDTSDIWLCLDNGFEAIPIAKFLSEEAAEQYKQAVSIAFQKSYAMGAFERGV